jgi:hypothetical protein
VGERERARCCYGEEDFRRHGGFTESCGIEIYRECITVSREHRYGLVPGYSLVEVRLVVVFVHAMPSLNSNWQNNGP